jgi:transposase
MIGFHHLDPDSNPKEFEMKKHNVLSGRNRRLVENWVEENVAKFKELNLTQPQIAVWAEKKFEFEVTSSNIQACMKACGIQWQRRSYNSKKTSDRVASLESQVDGLSCAVEHLASEMAVDISTFIMKDD